MKGRFRQDAVLKFSYCVFSERILLINIVIFLKQVPTPHPCDTDACANANIQAKKYYSHGAAAASDSSIGMSANALAGPAA